MPDVVGVVLFKRVKKLYPASLCLAPTLLDCVIVTLSAVYDTRGLPPSYESTDTLSGEAVFLGITISRELL